jgi:hypothetical protein
MIVRSTVEVFIQRDRTSEEKGFVEIEIIQTNKDDKNKEYTFQTSDKLVIIDLLGNESYMPIIQKEYRSQVKTYSKSYAEYDAQKEQLSQMFPTELTGSEAEDYWLQMGLLYNLAVDPIYGLTGDQWIPI